MVIPESERSWIGSAVTRWEAIEVSPFGCRTPTAFTTTGTPADCASLGIHNLFPNKPGLVISGVNMGENSGHAFFFSSGTVGAALTACLSEVPAVAVSMRMTEEIRSAWISADHAFLSTLESTWAAIAETAVMAVGRLVENDAFRECSLFSINMPTDATPLSPCRVVRIAHTRFNKIFVRRSDGLYVHNMEPFSMLECEEDHADCPSVSRGEIAIHPVGFNLNQEIGAKLKERIEG